MFLLQVVAPPQKPTKSTAGNKTSTKSSHKAKNNTSNASNSSRSKNDFVPPAFTKPSRRTSATLMSLADSKKYGREGYYKNSDEAASRRPSSRATESSKATEKDTSSINTDSTRSSSVSGTTLQQDEKQTNEEQPVRSGQNGGPQTVQMSTGNLEVIYGKPTTNAEYSKPRPTILANNKYPVPNNMRQFLTEYPSDDEKKDKK
ncbi:hypothetical protein Ddc_12793 [Ditylenchus destructor]|nr:hypothetical protein Ddc_12793 [Ditylenchus destructor]